MIRFMASIFKFSLLPSNIVLRSANLLKQIKYIYLMLKTFKPFIIQHLTAFGNLHFRACQTFGVRHSHYRSTLKQTHHF